MQNLKPYDKVAVVDPQTVTSTGADGKPQTTVVSEQTIAQGPVASQEIIKQFGTNGGGFFNANSAHPFENPTPLSNFLAMFGDLRDLVRPHLHARLDDRIAPARLGGLGGDGVPLRRRRHGRLLGRSARQPDADRRRRRSGRRPRSRSGGNMEGKEVRFGIANTALFATVTTDASCGAINGWHDSFTPLGGLVPLANMQLSEVVFGGVGAGMYGMLVYIILSVFIAGLMVGRTPEYLGKKIQAFEVQMAMLTVLIFSLLILTFTAISSVSPDFGTSSIFNPGPHGLSEMLYAYSSAAANNGSAFGGISVNTKWYNTTLGLAMLFGRFFMIIPPLAIAGSLSRKKLVPPSLGTFPVTTPLFAALLVGVIVIVGALTFFPALSLGPDRRALHDAGRTGVLMATQAHPSIWDPQIVQRAIVGRVPEAPPAHDGAQPGHVRRRVGSVLTTLRLIQDVVTGSGDLGFELQITFWLWLTVLFANFAEAMAEGRGKAQADTLRRAKTETIGQARARRTARSRSCRRAVAAQGRHRPRRRPARSSPPTARSSKASRRWTRARSPASRRRSFASRAAIARR